MEQHFNPIQDASRLQLGDIIVVPSEVNKKRKHLHMSLKSLSSIGVSSGFTCRSSNSSTAVRNLLVHDPGVSRVLVVLSVFHGYHYSGGIESALRPFIGNCVTEPPKLPVIHSAQICSLPYDDKCSRYSRLSYIDAMVEYVQNILLGKISNKLFFHATCPNNNGFDRLIDQCIADVFNSRHSRDSYSQKNIREEVPTNCTRDYETKMSREAISEFVSISNIFSRSDAFEHAKEGEIAETVVAQKKFFVEYAKRGAMFYRPSRKMLETIAARSLLESFKEYSEKCEKINAAAAYFTDRLKEGMASVAEKIKEAKELESYLTECGADDSVMNQLKEIIR